MLTSEKVHIHVPYGQGVDDAFWMAAAACLWTMVGHRAVEKVWIPVVIVPDMIPLVHLHPKQQN